jgi:hypothetical protein
LEVLKNVQTRDGQTLERKYMVYLVSRGAVFIKGCNSFQVSPGGGTLLGSVLVGVGAITPWVLP